MTRHPPFQPDPELSLPPLPTPVSHLEGPEGRMVLEGAAGPFPFLLAGGRAQAWGTEVEGLRELRLHSLPALRELDAGLGPGRTVRIAPGSIQRMLEGGAGSVIERILVFPELAAGAVQWSRPSAADTPLELDLCLELGPFPGATTGTPMRVRAEGAVLRVAGEEGAPSVLCFLDPAPERWEIEEVADPAPADRGLADAAARSIDDPDETPPGPGVVGLRLRVPVRCPRGGTIHLGIASSPGASAPVRDALMAFRSLGAQERLWARRGPADPWDALQVEASDPDVAIAIDWAKARVDSALVHDGPRGSRVALTRGPEPGASPGDDTGAVAGAEDAEAAWLGIGALAAGRFPLAKEVLDAGLGNRLRQGEAGAAPTSPHRLLLAEELARWSGSSGVLQTEKKTPGAADPLDTLLGEVEAGARGIPSPPAEATFHGALRAWALLRSGRTDEGWRLWRELLGRGLEPPRGMWAGDLEPEGEAPPDHLPTAALLLAGFVFGLLGARADAFFGRLHLRPQLPPEWGFLTVRNLQVGDARVSLAYSREGETHTFRLEQTEGRVPLNLIFEPLLPVREPRVLLNGDPVEVGRFEVGERRGVRFQLPLDREQVIVVSGG